MNFKYLAVLLVVACITFYTVSFGLWTWRQKNKPGAVMIFLVALTSMALPIYSLLFRD